MFSLLILVRASDRQEIDFKLGIDIVDKTLHSCHSLGRVYPLLNIHVQHYDRAIGPAMEQLIPYQIEFCPEPASHDISINIIPEKYQPVFILLEEFIYLNISI